MERKQSFQDAEGRTWSLALDVLAMRRVRDLCGVDLLDALNPDGKVLTRIASDSYLLFDVIECILSQQLDHKNLTAEDLARAMNNAEVCDAAGDALIGAILSFSRKPEAEVIAAAFGKMEQAIQEKRKQGIAKARQAVETPEFAKLVEQQAATLSTGGAQSSN